MSNQARRLFSALSRLYALASVLDAKSGEILASIGTDIEAVANELDREEKS